MPDPPRISPRFSDPPVVIGAGLVVWLVAALVLLVADLTAGRTPGEAFWSCAAGLGVGLFGATVFGWQRAAARRGSRLAQSGLDDE